METVSVSIPTQRTAVRGLTSAFAQVPATTLPNGTVVPAFRAARYLASRGQGGLAQVSAGALPWVNLDYHSARRVCAESGFALLTESQALAIGWDIARQDVNWTGGRVGQGQLFQGLHKASVAQVKPPHWVSPDPEERRWHQLSNGERVYDFSGNAFSWVFDDVQGNEQGIVQREFAPGSASICTAPAPSMEQGMGWRPAPGRDWWGHALARGGCYSSLSGAGVFLVVEFAPDVRLRYVGFRCTRPV